MSTVEAIKFPRPMTADGMPDPALRELATGTPVLRVTGPGEIGAWLVAGYGAVREALSDPSRFTSVIDPDWTDVRAKAGVSLVGLDPPEHARLRKLTAKAFTPRSIQRLVPAIERIVAMLLDDMETAEQPVDLIQALALPLPLMVTCQILDLPAEDRPDFLRWSHIFTGNTSHSMDEIADANDRLRSYMARLTSQRRDQLGEDVLSDFIRARDGQDMLTEDEILSTMVLLLVAGSQTTIHAIARGVLILISSGQWSRIVSREVPIEQAVEEILRHQSPIDTALFRRAKVDTELAGVPIKAGEIVFISVHLANFDPAVWDRPEVFDPGRSGPGHMAFGHGVHFCLGAQLARAELIAALDALAVRFPKLRLGIPSEQLTWTVDSWLNSPVSLPVTW